MHAIINFIQKFSTLDKNTTEALENIDFEVKTWDKNEIIVRKNTYCKHFFFITKGLVKMSFDSEDKEFIMRFFPENMVFTNLANIQMERRNKYHLIAVEKTTLISFSIESFEQLCKQHHALETFYRKFYRNITLNMMERISEILEEDAKTRYQNFLNKHPNLVQRISLGELANYLGITQVSLSRIRAKS